MGERQVQARQVVIATGSRPALSEAFRALGNWWLTTMCLPGTRCPDGWQCVIGLELGQALARLGVAVRVFGARGG